ncbi:S-adenosylmethionine-dependent methyltransferase Rv2258c-like isoform X2 [Haliotis cracherodii]|uniref:S-adenosylmethionine-dependent methyltransferase Rv2258c-like isoform X2 n=1 Tax=Haliotis cracherodii TaxID=6455 RepID=UPI0039E9477F
MEDTYAERLRGFFNAGCATTAIALAKDVGILKILLEADVPLTSYEISTCGSLKERYCREILGALVTADVIEVDSTSRKYFVPVSNRKSLAGAAIFNRLMPYFGEKYAAIKDCFREEGPAGVRYAAFPVAFDIMRELRVFHQDTLLEEFVLGVVPGLPKRLDQGIMAAELGCGYGILASNLAQRYPATTFIASDVVDELLETARQAASVKGLTNLYFECQDIYDLPDTYMNKFDWILVRDVIHDLPHPDRALRAIYRCLKPGGELSLLEVGVTGTLSENVGNMGACSLYTRSTFSCVPESFQRPDSAALGAAWNVCQAMEMIERAGFTLVKEFHNEKNKQDVHYICRK